LLAGSNQAWRKPLEGKEGEDMGRCWMHRNNCWRGDGMVIAIENLKLLDKYD